MRIFGLILRRRWLVFPISRNKIDTLLELANFRQSLVALRLNVIKQRDAFNLTLENLAFDCPEDNFVTTEHMF